MTRRQLFNCFDDLERAFRDAVFEDNPLQGGTIEQRRQRIYDAFVDKYKELDPFARHVEKYLPELFKYFYDKSEEAVDKTEAEKRAKNEKADNAIQPRSEGYSISKEKNSVDENQYVINFDKRVSKDAFKGQCAIARKLGGWYTRGKGFIFKTEEAAHDFAETVLGRTQEEVEDEAPLSIADIAAASGGKIVIGGPGLTDDATVAQATKKSGEKQTTDKGKQESKKDKKQTPTASVVNVESLLNALNENGEATLSDHATPLEEESEEKSTQDKATEEQPHEEAKQDDQPKQEKQQEEQPKAKSKWVEDEDAERFEELRKRLKEKLRGQMNMGVDPEILAIGVEMGYYMLKKGARKFGEFAKGMIETLGEEVRPYIKAFYNGARELPELADIEHELTPYDEVRRFDVMNFDKQGAKDLIATAENTVREQEVERQAQQATETIKQQRNEQRRETERQTAANTEAVASQAETAASEAESQLPSARTERQANDIARRIDTELERVNDQLALLGYYEAEPVEADYNEAFGYMRNAEKKAVKDVSRLAQNIAAQLGLDDYLVYDEKGKKRKNVSANIAPAGGDITMRLTLNRDKGVELYMDFLLTPDEHNNLRLTGIMYRPERGREYLRSNNYFRAEVTMEQMLHGIRSVCREWLPLQEDFVSMAQRIAAENADEQQKPAKEKKSKKKSATSQKADASIGDLFSGMFDEPVTAPTKKTKDNGEQEVHVQPRTGTAEREGGHEPRQNEPLGESQRNEAQRTDGGRVAGRGGSDTVSDTERGTGVSEPSAGRSNVKTEPAPLAESERRNTHNNHAERGTDYAPRGENARIEANIKAIETMQRLVESGEQATPEDMAVLRRFSGWGGLGAAFKEKVSSGMTGYDPRLRWDWQKDNPINKRLRELLTPEEYEAANMSRNSAYYTPAPVIDTMWDVARAMGFKGGSVLEGSAGIGNIIGLMPQDMSERSDIHAVEIDNVTGNILSLLYPDAKVDVQGFERTQIPNGSVDLAITNVPFVTGLHVMDETGDKDLSRKFRDIHDFCIAKNVRKLREGGIGIFITSSGTLDKSAKLRQWITSEGGADVVGAFRLNNKTFGGTGATSDIIVIRKRVNGRKSANAIDVSGIGVIRTVEYDNGESKKNSVKQLALDVNQYYVEHPENMAGEMAFAFEKGETFRATSKALYPVSSIDQEQKLTEWASRFKDMDWEQTAQRSTTGEQAVYEDLGTDVKEGSMLIDSDGNLCLAQRGKAVPLGVNSNKVKGHTKAECFTAYKAIKDALADLLDYQTRSDDNKGLQQRLDALGRAYDTFVNTYGHLNKNTAISFLRNDMDYPSVAALETVSETGDKSGKRIITYGKSDIFTRRVVEKESEPKPTNVKDGIIASIYLNGRVDVPYIAEQLGISEEEVRRQIIESGLGFENPATTEMEVSYEYLSGNVREKLRQAQEMNTDGRYDANIKALESKVPMDIPAHLIEFSLGSSWIEPKLYEDFIKERTGLSVTLTNAGGTWMMKLPYYTNEERNRAMGVVSEKCGRTIMGHELIGAAITCKSLTVSKTVKHYDGHTETIVDKEATMACSAKIDDIKQDFRDWARARMQADPEMSERMERVYNEMFNNYVPCEIPNEFVPEHFGGAAHIVNGIKDFKLRPHQAKAVIRSTMQPLMLAHEVGTGKTYTLISTAMEMRRLGTARKPMIVVQNATVGQFVASAKALYPNAKILTLSDKDKSKEGRYDFCSKVRYNDWDLIVIPQSTLDFIPDSPEREMAYKEQLVEEKLLTLEKQKEAAEGDSRNSDVRQTERELEKLRDEIEDLKLRMAAGIKDVGKDAKREAKTKQNAMVKAEEMLDRKTDEYWTFDELGIDALLVDEAHNYKHLGFSTAMQRGVKGIDPSFSKRSQGLYLKVQTVLEKTGGRNVVFATGTPISNTAAEIWTFMRYLMPADTMKEYGIYYFDDFVRNFGNVQEMLEFGTNGKFKPNKRFAGYVNLPELARIWMGVADIVLTREAGAVQEKIPQMEGGKATDIYLPQTKALRSVMKFVKKQLEDFENMSGKEKKENSHIPLTMYGIAQSAAVDPRLVLEDAPDEPNSKTNEAVRQTLRSLEETKDYKGTVAIFADKYMNKHSGFNLYEEIKRKLVAAGVPEEQIVIMQSNWKVEKKLKIFDAVNAGDVRVILGSTATLGTGVNIQERLHTLIHVDAPNRPMDYTQRNGRILRQGNLHNEWGIPVRVLRFGVEDSLDVTAYQRLKTKGAIADSIMEAKKMLGNSMENRMLEEEQDIFGDITAQLSGSEYALLKNQVEKEVRKFEARLKAWEADQTYIHNQKPRLRGMIKAAKQRQATNRDALAKVEAAEVNGLTVGKKHFESVDAMADFIKDFNSKQREIQEQVRKASSYGDQPKAERKLTVTVGGYNFDIRSVITKEQKKEKGQLTLSFFAQTKMTYSCPELGLQDVPVHGQQLKAALEEIMQNVMTGNDFREWAESAERSIERYESELKQIEARDGKPFEFADELKQAKTKLAEYTELMKKEMAEKEAKYAEIDKGVETATNVQLSEDDEEGTDDTASYRLVDDPKLINELEDGEWEEVYRVMQVIDGELYPPMAAVREGDLVAPIKLGVIEQAEEHPELITFDENGKPQFTLNKGQGKGTLKAAYNPYWHTSRTALNDQFSSAYIRPNLVVVRTLVPKSELTSGYHAKFAKDAVGEMSWHSGAVSGRLAELGKPRRVILSRYDKPMEIVPHAEVARMIAEQLQGTDIAIPYNVVWPQLADALEDLGVEISKEASGTVGDTDFGKAEYITDKQIAEMNAKAKEGMVKTPKAKRSIAERMGDKFNTAIRVVEDVNEIAHPNHAIQERRRNSFGWYDQQTGEVVVVLPNNRNVADVAATVFHETVGHKGLRELVGEENYSQFLREVYDHCKEEVRRRIAKLAAKNGWNFEKATDEYLAGLAEKGFEDFTEAERSIWQRLKERVLKAINKFLKSLKLPKWVRLGDNELRYMLWRSHENLRHGKEHPIDVARDVVKREELGLSESAYRMGDATETFKARQKRAVENRGTVMSGLNDAEVKVVNVPRHSYEVQKIGVLNDETPSTPNGRGSVASSKEGHYPLAKLLQNVEKSYDRGKKGLEQSSLSDEDTAMYRDPIETEDIWKDQSMGLQERITAAATRLATNHQGDKKLRNDAMRAIGGNLADLRKAMSLQRTFDMTTVKRVADLARVLMNGGYLNGMSQQEVKRLLAAVKNSVGHNDIEGSIQKVMDIMVDNQLKRAEDTLHSLETIRASKVDARGVEVQGQLDVAGQNVMKVFKKTRGLEEADIEEAIGEAVNRMGSDNTAVAEEAAQEYTGLQLALEYVQNIKGSEAEEQRLRDELKNSHDETDKSDRATESYRQYVASLHDAIRQCKIERAQAYFNLVARLSDSLRESIANATTFKEAKKQRIREIQHNANSDMEGVPSDEHRKDTWQTKLANNGFVQFFFSPLQSFDQILRFFGNKSANGEGYLYNRFMRGWIDAREKELRGVTAKNEILDEKVQEVFGKRKMKWADLIQLERKLPKATVSFWNGGEMQDFEMPQGNLLYIYMVNKMLDGRMKLRKMGITEQDVERIEDFIDPRLKEIGDWLQNEFLVETRNEYNETHKRLFGASMAAIEDYFPLKILKNARADKAEELDAPNANDGISTKTGSIIKRRRNALALDLTNADAFSVVLEHITQMEHWNAYAEWNDDLNTLRTYKHFRNQVQNMSSIYGGGKLLWENFNKLCQMAAGSYRPPRAMMDEAAVNFAKGVSAAKVNFRLYTAFKQLASMPIYTAAASARTLASSIIHPFKAWNWAMENLPLFRERWASHQSGDPRLLKNEKDWKMWRSRVMELSSRLGMLPNAFVDAVTVSIGSHAVYETARKHYLNEGYSEEQAERKALQDAELRFNQMQMTSEGAFLSPVQVDNTWFSVAFTVFRRDSIAYGRMLHDALRNLKRNLTPGQRQQSIAFMAKQIEREGLTPEDALRAAHLRFNRQLRHDVVRVAVFGFIAQALFNFLAYLPYLLVGDDDEEKNKLLRSWFSHSAFSALEGLNGGDVMSLGAGYLLNGEGNPQNLNKDMPLSSDVFSVLKKLGSSKQQEALSDVVNIIVQSFAGVNPQTITDAAVAIMDACGNDPATAHEAMLLFMRISQVPQSQLDNLYFDEVGLSGEEASKYTPAQLAERYARYKVKRGAFFSPWNWDNKKMLAKQRDKANKTIKERTARLGEQEVNEAYQRFEEIHNGVDEKVKKAKKAAKTDYAEAAKLMSEAQSNVADFTTYTTFKALDKNLDKVVKFYLSAKTAEEAALCLQAATNYKAAMVDVLKASDAAARNKAMGELSSVMSEFMTKYTAMHPAKQ